MEDGVILELEENTVRFTANGRIAVIDAIGALSETDCPTGIWEELKRSHPQIANICSNHCFSREGNTPVADSESWEIIQTLLLDHLIDNEI